MRQQGGIRGLTGSGELGHEASELAGVPVDDGGGQEVEPSHAVMLALRAAVTDLAAGTQADGALEGGVGLALVEAQLSAALQVGVGDPAQKEQRALDAPDLTQREGEFVLARV